MEGRSPPALSSLVRAPQVAGRHLRAEGFQESTTKEGCRLIYIPGIGNRFAKRSDEVAEPVLNTKMDSVDFFGDFCVFSLFPFLSSSTRFGTNKIAANFKYLCL